MTPAAPIARIAQLWRYPVKSMRGEQVDTLDLLVHGIAYDRRYAIESSAAPAGKPLLTGRERAAMLLYTASVHNGETHILTPQGTTYAITDPALLRSMQAALPQPVGTLTLRQSERPLTDVRPVAILSLQTIAELNRELATAVDPRRFRANILLDFTSPAPNSVISTEAQRSGELRILKSENIVISTEAQRSGETCTSSETFPEDTLVGRSLRLGPTATLRITERDPAAASSSSIPKPPPPTPD